jgi:cell wall-associated NlpC family hydrolase
MPVGSGGPSLRPASDGPDCSSVPLDSRTNGSAGDGKAENERGYAGATGVRDSARSQAAAIAPATGSPAWVKLLVSSMDERPAAMQRQIDTTKTQNRLLATRLRQVAAAYRSASTAAPTGGMSALGGMGGAMGGLRGLGGAMPNLGGLAAGPMGAISALGHMRGAAGEPAALDNWFGRDERASGAAAQAVAYARTKVGLPYVWGAAGPRAYDCSGLVMDAYGHAGISLPYHTYEQMQVGSRVSPNDIREGDRIMQGSTRLPAGWDRPCGI